MLNSPPPLAEGVRTLNFNVKKPNAKQTRQGPQTPEQLRALGAGKRVACPRASLAQWDPSLRPRQPQDLLAESVQGRLPKLIALKNQRMAASPFGFFRGAVPVMAYDLSLVHNTGILTQLCGDAHVQNLGSFAGPDGRLMFDINDFDETIQGPFDWDVRRMATSIVLAGTAAKLKHAEATDAAELFLHSYAGMMARFACMPILEVARYQVHRLGTVAPITKILFKAQRETPLNSLKRLIEPGKQGPRFRSEPPVLRPVLGNEKKKVLASLAGYADGLQPERRHFLAQFRPLAVAFKVVGTGSVGLRDYCVYLEGNGTDDPLFLQIKQEARSAWAPYLKSAADPGHEGRRVAEGQRAMQIQSDPMLGWTRIDGRDFLVRQLNDHKASLDVTTLQAEDLSQYAAVCGEILARGHARAGDARVLSGYIGTGNRFQQAIVHFAAAYAEQTEADWKQMCGHEK